MKGCLRFYLAPLKNLTINNFPFAGEVGVLKKNNNNNKFFLQYEVLKIFAHKKLDKLCA